MPDKCERCNVKRLMCNVERLMFIVYLRMCHSIFALSLTRFAFRNPNGITYGYATFDLLLQNLSITKRCFVILNLV